MEDRTQERLIAQSEKYEMTEPMNPTEIAAMVADMQAGTTGPWFVAGVRVKMDRQQWLAISRYDEANKRDENICCAGYDPKDGLGSVDARRIARVPAMDQTILALSAQLAATQARHDVKIYAMTAERDYDRRATAHLQTVVDKLNAHISAVTAERDAAVARVLKAAGEEYILEHVMETDWHRQGRHSAVRGMIVRLDLYSQLEAAIDAAIKEGTPT